MTVSDAIRVLIVDDEEDVRIVLGLQLGIVEGIEVVGDASEGAEAIELCRTLRPQVVVMDLLMPNVNGFEAIARIQEEMPEIGIVAYTGVAGDYVRVEMERVNVPLVLKSGDPEALVDALRRVAVPD
jgi:DNA-binding NarL/FixJ family response regulator